MVDVTQDPSMLERLKEYARKQHVKNEGFEASDPSLAAKFVRNVYPISGFNSSLGDVYKYSEVEPNAAQLGLAAAGIVPPLLAIKRGVAASSLVKEAPGYVLDGARSVRNIVAAGAVDTAIDEVNNGIDERKHRRVPQTAPRLPVDQNINMNDIMNIQM